MNLSWVRILASSWPDRGADTFLLGAAMSAESKGSSAHGYRLLNKRC
jgi:hypothetical protein